MNNIKSNSVEDNYLAALKWLDGNDYIPDNYIAFSVPATEMIMLHTVLDRYFTPFAPITEGMYSICQRLTKEISSGKYRGVLETVIFGSPAYIYNITKWSSLSELEQQAIWVHGFFHIYQNKNWFDESYRSKRKTIVETDQKIKIRLESLSRNSNAHDEGVGQIFVSILNLLAASCPKYVWNFSNVNCRMTHMYEIFLDLKNKYVDIYSLPLNKILVEGTATDIQIEFLNQNESHSKLLDLDRLPPSYHFGTLISQNLRSTLKDEWDSSLKTCQDDVDFLRLFINKFSQEELDEIYQIVKNKYCTPHANGLTSVKKKHWEKFEFYYDIIQSTDRPTHSKLISPPLQLLFINHDCAILIQNIPYLDSPEIFLLSYFLSKSQEIPLFPHIILLSRSQFMHAVAVKHSKDFQPFVSIFQSLEDMYEVSLKFNSLDDSTDFQNRMISDKLIKKIKSENKFLQDEELNYIFQALEWLDL